MNEHTTGYYHATVEYPTDRTFNTDEIFTVIEFGDAEAKHQAIQWAITERAVIGRSAASFNDVYAQVTYLTGNQDSGGVKVWDSISAQG